jgi:hypothetical protein
MTRTLIRCLGFDVALLVAAAIGVLGFLLWGEQPLLPLIRLPVPMPTLFPVLVCLTLTWTLHERWRQQLSTTARRASVVPSLRFIGTQAMCGLAACIAASAAAHPGPVIAFGSVGASLAALFTLALGQRAVFGLLICAYLWLSLAAHHPLNFATQHSGLLAAIGGLGYGGLYVLAEARRS